MKGALPSPLSGMLEKQDELYGPVCAHGRHATAYCGECASDEIQEDFKKPAMKNSKKSDQPNGLDAPYYDLPEGVNTAQDLIEWLDLNFANGNILKSLIREHNPNAKKKTDELYEAEKRYFFASRHLRRVQALRE